MSAPAHAAKFMASEVCKHRNTMSPFTRRSLLLGLRSDYKYNYRKLLRMY